MIPDRGSFSPVKGRRKHCLVDVSNVYLRDMKEMQQSV